MKSGHEINELRQKRGISLRELGRLAGISPASLSAIEKGTSSPTLATLQKVLKALGTDFSEFFSDTMRPDNAAVFPAAGMRCIEDANRKYALLFPKGSDLRFEMIDETILPGDREGEWEIHDFDIGGVLLEGGPMRLEIFRQGRWDLNVGDAFYVKAGMKHRAGNRGKGPLRLITVADPPRY